MYQTMKALTLILTFSIIAAFSQATSILVTQPLPKKINVTKLINGDCNYKVTIKTSCESPLYTRDKVSVLFGDAYGSEIQVLGLDDPNSGMLRRCNTDTYTIVGPCIEKICKLFLFRTGIDGWIPQTVTVDDYVYPPVTFYYINTFIPNDGDGYGFNYCLSM